MFGDTGSTLSNGARDGNDILIGGSPVSDFSGNFDHDPFVLDTALYVQTHVDTVRLFNPNNTFSGLNPPIFGAITYAGITLGPFAFVTANAPFGQETAFRRILLDKGSALLGGGRQRH